MSELTHGSLFTGIGGFDLAAEWAGIETLFQVEKDDFCLKVLEKNFPDVKRYEEVKTFNAKDYEGKVDIISGGFPCQPFSHAGKKRGHSDDRYLWDEMFRVIQESKPEWVLAENVYGLISNANGMVLEQVLTDLESEGFEVQTFVLPACGKNAPHRRDRVWIIAHSKSNGNRLKLERERGEGNERGSERRERMGHQFDYSTKIMAETSWERNWLEVASELCGTDDGVSKGLDKDRERMNKKAIKALGNAIVPHIAYEFFNTIVQMSHKTELSQNGVSNK